MISDLSSNKMLYNRSEIKFKIIEVFLFLQLKMNRKHQGQKQGAQGVLDPQEVRVRSKNDESHVAVQEKRQFEQQGLNIVFSNLAYSVQIEEKSDNPAVKEKQVREKVLLNNLSGVCRGGEVSAIMGPSGAGKTTLLNLLACRIESKQGKVLANNLPYNYESFGNFANYVMQQDVLMQTLTVRETLQFAARLKLRVPEAEQDEKIMGLCKRLKLEKCLDVLVGGKLIKGISGGEKKRTSIAFELISDPSVIMLDEPTSGLDSLTSYIIIDFLAELAHKQGKTVLMTIHQPSSEIFFKFDRLFLLVEGNLVYQGRAADGEQYFASKLNKQMAEFVNPADFFIQEMHPENKDLMENLPFYCDTYKKYILPSVEKEISEIQEIQSIPCRESVNSLTQTYSVLLKRDVLNTIRNPMIVKSRIFMSIFLSIYTGGLYFNAATKDINNQANWQALVGYFYFMAISNMMASLSPVSLVFPAERDVFLKEEGSRFYGVLPYFISRNVVEIPYLILFPMLVNLIMYWMVGQANTAGQFFLFYLISFIVNFAGSSLGLLIGSISKDQKSGAAITPIIILPIFVFAGVFKNRANLPDWIGWFEYLSPLKYGFASSLLNQVSDKVSRVSQLNFELTTWGNIGVLIALSFGFRLLSLFFLWILRKKLE